MKKRAGLDRFDLEAMNEGRAVSRFNKEYRIDKPKKADAKRKTHQHVSEARRRAGN